MAAFRILFIGYVWPETRSSGAGLRTRALVEQALEAGHEVHFAAPSKETVFTEELRALGVNTHFVQANDPEFDSWIQKLAADIVVLDRFVLEEQFGWRIREHSPQSVLVIDMQDMHSLRRAREAQVQTLDENSRLVPETKPDLYTEDTFREMASILRADLSLVISSAEYRLLVSMGIPEGKLLLLPFSYSVKDLGFDGPPLEDRKNFVSLGNFRHPPNLDSVKLLMNQIWPRIAERIPGAELHLYGAYTPKEISDRDGKIPGLRVRGPCDHAIQTLSKYRVLLAPLRFGAGLKGKIADAWCAGTAVCTTSVGAEGLTLPDGFAGVVGDRLTEFVENAVAIYESDLKLQALSEAGKKSAHSLFSFSGNGETWLNAMKGLVENRVARRRADFLQGLTCQQSLGASRYLSKWIELKNRSSLK